MMKSHPRFFKAHAKIVADELLRAGWTLRHEFRAEGDEEPYEYIFEWIGAGEPVAIDPNKFAPPRATMKEDPNCRSDG